MLRRKLGPRFVPEALFIVGVAAVALLLELTIPAALALTLSAWLAVAVLEIALSRRRPSQADAGTAPAAPAPVTWTDHGERGHERDGAAAEGPAEALPVAPTEDAAAPAVEADVAEDRAVEEDGEGVAPPVEAEAEAEAEEPEQPAPGGAELAEPEPAEAGRTSGGVSLTAAEEPAPGVAEPHAAGPRAPAGPPVDDAGADEAAEPAPAPAATEPEESAQAEPAEPADPGPAEPEDGEEPAAPEEAVPPAPRLAAVPEPEPGPEPEQAGPEPEPQAERAPEPGIAAVVELRPAEPREWNLWELERLARARSGEDAARDEEWGYLLMHLRGFASPEGLLPRDFDALVRESFAVLLDPVP